MEETFIKRDLYNKNTFLDKEAFLFLLKRFEQIGFKDQKIVLPIEGARKRKNDEDIPQSSKVLSVDGFVGLDQDFGGIVVRLYNNDTNEEVVLLFRNDLEKILYFTDNIFHTTQGELTSNLYVSSGDPVRTYGLVFYLKDFFKNRVRNPGLRELLTFLVFCVLAGGVFIVFKNPFNLRWLSVTVGLFGPTILLPVLSRLFPQRGVHISSVKRPVKYPSYIEKVRDNWLLVFITAAFSVGGTLLALFLANLFGLQQ